jgi:hypothetical protein
MLFITVLVSVALMGVQPPEGWLQGIQPYTTKEVCESYIPQHEFGIHMSIEQWLGGLGEVVTIECMTLEEWLEKNLELGHEEPLYFSDGVNPLKPEKSIEKKDTM